jgi:hypothetical protein
MKIYSRHAATLLATLVLLGTVPAQAALNTYNFSGALDSGALMGETFTGQFSFDDATLMGVGGEYLNVNALNLNFHSHAYTQADAAAATEVAFMDGAFLGLSFAVDSSFPEFALTPGFFDVTEAYLAYQPGVGASGYGSVAYTLAPVPVPLPATFGMLLAGLGLFGFFTRKRR